MKLVFLVANHRWAFTLGTQLIRLDNQPTFGLFWIDRKTATEAALARGIYVAEDGSCYTIPEDLSHV